MKETFVVALMTLLLIFASFVYRPGEKKTVERPSVPEVKERPMTLLEEQQAKQIRDEKRVEGRKRIEFVEKYQKHDLQGKYNVQVLCLDTLSKAQAVVLLKKYNELLSSLEKLQRLLYVNNKVNEYREVEKDFRVLHDNLSILEYKVNSLEPGEIPEKSSSSQYAWDLARRLWGAGWNGTNSLFSPLGVGILLGMTGNAADEDGAGAIAQFLGFDNMAKANASLGKAGQVLFDADKKAAVSLANCFVVNDNYTIKSSFKKNLVGQYNALIQTMPFDKPDLVQETVDKWCSEQTRGMITHIPMQLSPYSVSVLLNAVYFKCKWSEPFHEEDTRQASFFTMKGETVPVRMMYHEFDAVECAENEHCQSVILPYGNGSFRMTIYLPKDRDEKSLKKMLDTRNHPTHYSKEGIVVSMPKFEYECSVDLTAQLEGLGLLPDLDGALVPKEKETLGETPIRVSRVVQKTRIITNEQGTEAAAATWEVMEGFICNIFTANHPFVYTISEWKSGQILFVGVFTGENN